MTESDFSKLLPGRPPLLDHPLDEPSAFRPEDLVDAVRSQRGIGATSLPEVCILDFDGDLTDALIEAGELTPCRDWPCFHTAMWEFEVDGRRCGLVARTIGGPYAVLVAEQLAVCGVRAVVGVTSAGRVGSRLPVPGVVVADRAVRDEGTSYHYLPASETVEAPAGMADALEPALKTVGLPVLRGLVWTTDAPYRETAGQIARHAGRGALAVEMQAASLFAFASARVFPVGVVAHVTNAPEHDEDQFDKGTHDLQRELLHAACRGAYRYLKSQAAPSVGRIRKAHWESIYSSRDETAVSWYQENPQRSLELIQAFAPPEGGRIIDVGGGASVLVDRLLERSFGEIAVLDISADALGKAKARLGERAGRVRWIEADVTERPALGVFDVWHDRAVFHFLTSAEDRRRYVELAERTIPVGGHLIIATFAADGPAQCSGLDVRRYNAVTLSAELGPSFMLVQDAREQHTTPWGTSQSFFHGVFERRST